MDVALTRVGVLLFRDTRASDLLFVLEEIKAEFGWVLVFLAGATTLHPKGQSRPELSLFSFRQHGLFLFKKRLENWNIRSSDFDKEYQRQKPIKHPIVHCIG